MSNIRWPCEWLVAWFPRVRDYFRIARREILHCWVCTCAAWSVWTLASRWAALLSFRRWWPRWAHQQHFADFAFPMYLFLFFRVLLAVSARRPLFIRFVRWAREESAQRILWNSRPPQRQHCVSSSACASNQRRSRRLHQSAFRTSFTGYAFIYSW